MSTRSRIGTTNPNGSITSVYCHSDGYLDSPHGVGHKLFEHYKEPAKIAELIALGDLSSLHELVAPPPGVEHNFDTRADGVSVAYTRDRGETGCDAATDPNVAAFLVTANGCGAEFAYLWAGVWVVWETCISSPTPSPENAQPLELALVTARVTA